MKHSQRPPTCHDKAVWLNVRARFPGFTDEVAKFYWGLVDDDGLDTGSGEFVRMLLAKWPDGIDIGDLAGGGAETVADLSKDVETVRKWAQDVLSFHSYIESVFDGSELVPIGQAYGWRMAERIERLKRENAGLVKAVSDLERDISVSREHINDIPHKRKTSIYKMLLGVAIGSYGYIPNARGDSVRKIKNSLEDSRRRFEDIDCGLDEDTILKTLRDAYNHVTGAADPD